MSQSWSETPRTLTATTDQPDICTQWRVWNPTIELAARGYIADYCVYSDLPQFEGVLRYGRYTTLCTPRMAFDSASNEAQWLTFINSLRPTVKWFYDCDDDLWSDQLIDRLIATHRWPNPDQTRIDLEYQRQSRLRLIAQADGITVGSDQLAELARRYTKTPVYVVPNGITVAHYSNQTPRSIPPLTIGWSGGPRLESDLEPLYEVWAKVAQARPDVHFIVQGWVPPKMAMIVPANRFHGTGGLPTEQYTSYLQNIDIFCCPAPNDPWVRCKTPIKWYEATLAGSACVVSPYLYGPVVNSQHGPHTAATALVAETVDEWVRCLLLLIDEPTIRQNIQDSAKNSVLANYTLRQTYVDWLNAWGSALHN